MSIMKRATGSPGLPPVLATAAGQTRRVGIELELGGLELDTLAEIVRTCWAGHVERLSEYERVIHTPRHGDWAVELDFALLKRRARDAESRKETPSSLQRFADEILRTGAEYLAPLEVVSPPLPIDQLGEVETLVERLRAAGARGTTDALVYAFGLHFNPELPATDAATITRYLKAFACLYPWLDERADIDLSRKLTLFADPFPDAYVQRLIASDYWPSLDALIDDYLLANPTRNRALDCLPLFLYLDPVRVRAIVGDPRVKPRPTLHYRLPNCEIDRPDWGIHIAWNDWLQVERLATERERLAELCERYRRFLARPLGYLLGDWVQELDGWLPLFSRP
jgi:hypothetical protein